MGEKAHKNGVGIPEPPNREQVEAQLRESQEIRAVAEKKVVQAEQTANEMSQILRKLAATIDRNPKSWDELFKNGDVI